MSLIAHWPLNGTLEDYSGNGHTGTNYGATTTDGGPLGKYYYFNGVNNTINFGTGNNYFPLHQFSISCWFRCDGTTETTGVSPGLFGFTFGIRFFIYSTYLNFILYTKMISTNYCILNSPSTYNFYTDNKWHHVVITNNSTKLFMYIDGILVNSIDIGYTWLGYTYWTTDSWNIGRDNNNSNYYFKGGICDVRIYDEALNENEIKEIYQTKILHYTFNDEYEEPTENIIVSQNKEAVGKNSTAGWVANQNATISNEDNSIKCLSNQTSSTPGMYITLNVVSNTTYVFSADIISNVAVAFSSYDTSQSDSYTLYKTKTRHSLIFNSNSLTSLRLFFFMTSVTTSSYFKVSNIQVEAKDHATPFVNGIRTGIVRDSSGFRNDGTIALTTSPSYSTDTNLGSGCFSFISPKYIEGPLINLNTSDFTISLWCKIPSTQTTGATFHSLLGCKTTNGASSGFAIYWNNNYNKLLWSTGNDSSAVEIWTSSTLNSILLDDEFHHIIMVRNSSSTDKGYFFIDGIKYSLASIPSIIDVSTTRTLKIGACGDFNSNFYTDETVSDLKIFSTALSDDDIKELYNKKFSLNCKGNFECNELVEYDSSTSFVQPLLTENGVMWGDSFAVEADSYNSDLTGYEPFNSFSVTDYNTPFSWDTKSFTATDSTPHWFTFYNPKPLKVNSITFNNRNTDSGIMTKFKIQGSQNNIQFFDLTSVLTNSITTALASWNVDIGGYGYFKFHRIVIYQTTSSSFTTIGFPVINATVWDPSVNKISLPSTAILQPATLIENSTKLDDSIVLLLHGNSLSNQSQNKIALINNGVTISDENYRYLAEYKELIPQMTSDTTPSGKATASRIYRTGYEAYKAFNKDSSNWWDSYTDKIGAWIQYEFPKLTVVNRIGFYGLGDNANERIQNFDFYGTSDLINYTLLTSNTHTNSDDMEYFEFTNFTKYKAYKLIIRSMWGGNGACIREMQFYNNISELPLSYKALSFNSTYLNLGNSSLGLCDNYYWTIDWWEYRESIGESTSIFRKASTAAKNGIIISYNPNSTNNTISSFYYSSDGTNYIQSSITMWVPSYNEWVHYAVVRNDENILCFKNGTLTATINVGHTLPYNDGTNFMLGKGYTTDSFVGRISEFRISNVARWTANFTPPTEPYTIEETESDVITSNFAHETGTINVRELHENI